MITQTRCSLADGTEKPRAGTPAACSSTYNRINSYRRPAHQKDAASTPSHYHYAIRVSEKEIVSGPIRRRTYANMCTSTETLLLKKPSLTRFYINTIHSIKALLYVSYRLKSDTSRISSTSFRRDLSFDSIKLDCLTNRTNYLIIPTG